jgi:hypothetical protein
MRFLAVLLLLVVVRAKNSNTTLEQRLARTIARVWKPISEEVVPQVFPGAEEQAVLECLSTPGKQIGVSNPPCLQAVGPFYNLGPSAGLLPP